MYHAKDDPTTIIKYQSDCGSLRKLHPAFLNHHFQGLAAAAGLAPRVGFLSPGMIVLPGSSAKFPFDATPAQLLNCHNAGGSIRLLEMDKAGRSLWNYGRKKTVLVAARLGIRMITLVKRLHEDAGIVHGDIHNGNFLFSTDNEDDPLMLIDFERSGYADQLVDSRVIYNLKVHYMHSPWEALGYRRSRRDDVYRTVYSIAQIMQDSAWLNFEQHQVATDAAASIVRKRTEFIFASPSFDPIERMRATKVIKTRVRELLWDVLHAARSPKTPNDRPRYEDILEALSQIANLLAPQ